MDRSKAIESLVQHYYELMARPDVSSAIDTLWFLSGQLKMYLNTVTRPYEGWQIIAGTILAVFIIQYIQSFFFQEKSIYQRFKRAFFRWARNLPGFSFLISSKLRKAVTEMKIDLDEPIAKLAPNFHLGKAKSKDAVLKELRELSLLGNDTVTNGQISGTVYQNDTAFTDTLVEAYGLFALSNPLHPDVFPGVRKIESEVVQMCVNMFNGNDNCCGIMTSGGTESILMACKAYRDRARDRGITKPEMVLPDTAHAAFDKAGDYFGIKLVHVPVSRYNRRADAKAMRRAINKNTIMLVGSCPSFPHGTIDPIEELSEIALDHDIGLHVDCCLGSFLVAFMEKAGFAMRPFDFRLPGVTSISCDTHKYGYSPKGSSVIMYNSKELRRYQYFLAPNWTGGIYASPSIAGSRPGALVAATWAAMTLKGSDGYIAAAKQIISSRQRICKELSDETKNFGFFIYGIPEVSVVAFGSTKYDIYRLSGLLNERKWNLNSLQYPSSFHICLTLVHTKDIVDKFIKDVIECDAEIMKAPQEKSTGKAALYGMSQSVPSNLVEEITTSYLDLLYDTKPSEQQEQILAKKSASPRKQSEKSK